MTRIPLDPSAAALIVSDMIQRGEALPTPPEPTRAPCPTCGTVLKERDR